MDSSLTAESHYGRVGNTFLTDSAYSHGQSDGVQASIRDNCSGGDVGDPPLPYSKMPLHEKQEAVKMVDTVGLALRSAFGVSGVSSITRR